MNTADKKVHILSEPLRIASANVNQYYLLPAGTTLYYDKSLDEGPDRFYVYINVEGPRRKLEDLRRPDLIAPLTAHPLEQEDIVNAITKYPINKGDLVKLLNAKPLTRHEAQEIIDELQSYIAGLSSTR